MSSIEVPIKSNGHNGHSSSGSLKFSSSPNSPFKNGFSNGYSNNNNTDDV